MQGFTAFKLWTAMKLHFTTKNFNVFENRGRIKGKFETYLARNDYKIIEHIASKFTTREFVLYLASNFLYGYTEMMWEDSAGIANYNQFIGRQEQIGHIVERDIKFLEEANIKLTDGISIVRYLTKNEIAIESVVLINQYKNITNKIRELPPGKILEPLLLRIDKAQKFIIIPAGVDKLLKTKLHLN